MELSPSWLGYPADPSVCYCLMYMMLEILRCVLLENNRFSLEFSGYAICTNGNTIPEIYRVRKFTV